MRQIHPSRNSHLLMDAVRTLCLAASFLFWTPLPPNTALADGIDLDGKEPMHQKGYMAQHTPSIPDKETIMALTNSKQVHSKDRPARLIVIIGASYAKSWPLDDLHGVKVINKGVSGEQSSEMLARFNTDVLSLKPSHVIIWGFINDIFRSEKYSLQDKLENTKNNFEKMVELAQRNEIVPIMATEVTIRPPKSLKETIMAFIYGTILGKKSYQDYVNQHVVQVNEWLADFANKKNVGLLDFENTLSNNDGLRIKQYATEDGSHISNQGYDALANYTQKQLIHLTQGEHSE